MIRTPHIYLLARPQFTDAHRAMLEETLPRDQAHWLEHPGPTPAERLVEFAGRVCYMSFGQAQSRRSNADYIRNLIRNGHDSVLEHAVWTFALTGISRAFTHQLVRHRAGFSFSQLSQQYHDETEANFVRPRELDASAAAGETWDAAIAATQMAYRTLLHQLDGDDFASLSREEKRALRSAARSVLPNAIESAIVVTANARAIRHFLKVRGDTVGDLEMRAVCSVLLDHLRPEAPTLFEDFIIETHSDGMTIVRSVPAA